MISNALQVLLTNLPCIMHSFNYSTVKCLFFLFLELLHTALSHQIGDVTRFRCLWSLDASSIGVIDAGSDIRSVFC